MKTAIEFACVVIVIYALVIFTKAFKNNRKMPVRMCGYCRHLEDHEQHDRGCICACHIAFRDQ